MRVAQPRSFVLGAWVALATVCAAAQETQVDVQATALPATHPLVGRWRMDLPRVGCHEIHELRADGTADLTSGAQVAGSAFQISAQPSARGYYKWVDKVVTGNGKPDCVGQLAPTGQVATNYLLLHPSGRELLICAAESRETCEGPLRRVGGE